MFSSKTCKCEQQMCQNPTRSSIPQRKQVLKYLLYIVSECLLNITTYSSRNGGASAYYNRLKGVLVWSSYLWKGWWSGWTQPSLLCLVQAPLVTIKQRKNSVVKEEQICFLHCQGCCGSSKLVRSAMKTDKQIVFLLTFIRRSWSTEWHSLQGWDKT